MKKILLMILAFCSLLILSGCFLYGEKEETTVGDLVYLHVKTNSDEYYSVIGLSEEGKLKSRITVPAEVNGLSVNKIGFLRSKTRVGSITSDKLEIIYLEKYIEFAHTDFFIDCPNLEKIICLEFEDKFEEFYDYREQYVKHNLNKENEQIRRLPIYVYPSKDFVEDSQDNLYVYANIIYYNDNNTVYYIDYSASNKIEKLPDEPVRDGYKFLGWYKEPDCINEWNFAEDNLNEIINLEYSVQFNVNKLYAKWEEVDD